MSSQQQQQQKQQQHQQQQIQQHQQKQQQQDHVNEIKTEPNFIIQRKHHQKTLEVFHEPKKTNAKF